MARGEQALALANLEEVRGLCLPLDAHPALDRADRLAARLTIGSERPGGEAALPAAPRLAPAALPFGLSPREAEALRLVAAGLDNATIAERLFLSPRTVKSHVANIYGKLGVTNRAAATRLALDHGLA